MARSIMPRTLTDRQTGRAIYRYSPHEMSGPLPLALYKYLRFDHGIAMIERGEIMFSTLSWFQAIEDPDRGDGLEGTHKYFPVGGPEVTRTARDGKPHPPVTMRLPSQSIQSKAKGRDHIFIYSTSMLRGLTKWPETVCVEIFDPAKLVARLRTGLRRLPAAKPGTLIYDRVGYYAVSDPPGSVYALPHMITMHKRVDFQDEQEYRIAFGTRADVFDFEHVDMAIVGEGVRSPRPMLDERRHRKLLRVGSLADCCRIVEP
jgi:hypothetical protein